MLHHSDCLMLVGFNKAHMQLTKSKMENCFFFVNFVKTMGSLSSSSSTSMDTINPSVKPSPHPSIHTANNGNQQQQQQQQKIYTLERKNKNALLCSACNHPAQSRFVHILFFDGAQNKTHYDMIR